MIDNRKVFFKIIVPNFNNYIYIIKCLDSIKEQTFKDYVCIVVDDLSTDNSFKIAQIYAKRDPEHFIALKMDKKGHEGGARNKGIDYPIDCEYYMFIDSDDFLKNDEILQKLVNSTENKKIDVVIYGLREIKNGKENDILPPEFNWDINKIAFKYSSACTKIVKSQFIEKFLENCDHAADTYWSMKIFNHHPSIKTIRDSFYVYRRNPNSVTYNGKYRDDTNLFYDKFEQLLKYINDDYVKQSMEKRIRMFRTGEIDW